MTPTAIRSVSKKRQRENKKRRDYTKHRLAQNPYCEIRAPGCTRYAQALHETLKRSAGGAITPGEKATRQHQTFIRACNGCNQWVEDNPQLAREQGWSRSRHRHG